MKFLGIDYGTKRIGLAVSDEGGVLAFAREILLNDANTFKKIAGAIKKENIKEIIIGESLDFKDQPNILSARIEIFIKELEKRFQLPIHKQKEFLTSVEARNSQDSKKSLHVSGSHSKFKKKKDSKVDAQAAALILQRYLDRKNKQEN